MAARILIVDDDPLVPRTLCILLRKHGYEARAAASTEEALDVLTEQSFDVVISDINMPGADGFDGAKRALPEELELIKKLGEFPEVVMRAVQSREPHHLAYYLRDVAGQWNPYVQDGKHHRVLSDDRELTAARLGLVLAVRTVIARGLALLGLGAPETM